MAITQEDCISAHRAEKKRKTPTGPSTAQPPRYRLVQNTTTRAPPRNNLPGRWVARPPQQARFNRPPTPQPQQQQQGPRPSFPSPNQGNNNYRCFNCGSPSHFIKDCPQARRSFQGQTSNPNSKGKGKKEASGPSPPGKGEFHHSLRPPRGCANNDGYILYQSSTHDYTF
jgi:hypothetical protein